jgi:hypothetical protein
MTVTPEYVDLHRLVDQLDPDQVRALRAVAEQMLRARPGGEERSHSVLAEEPVRDLSFIGLFEGEPDLSERARDILREDCARRADADR